MSRRARITLLVGLLASPLALAAGQAELALAQQRVEGSAAAVQRALAAPDLLPENARKTLATVKVIHERSPLTVLRHENRFGSLRVVVDDGWLRLAEDLLLAAALPVPGCLQAYAAAVLPQARANLEAIAQDRRDRLRALPRLADHVEAVKRDPSDACRKVDRRALLSVKARETALTGLDALLFWSIAREMHGLLQPGAVCAPQAADALASQAARLAGLSLQPATAGVLAHAALWSPEACAGPRARLDAFLASWVAADQWERWRAALPPPAAQARATSSSSSAAMRSASSSPERQAPSASQPPR